MTTTGQGKPAMPAHRRAILLTIVLSLLPIVIGASLYYYGWRPGQTSNHGMLVNPPVPLAIDTLKGKWTLAYVADGPCDAACATRIDELRRVRVSLAKELGRTRHAWFGQGAAVHVTALKSRTPDLLALERPASLPNLPNGSVIIVDPAGLLMMRYAPGAEPKGMRADLERLLKYSWIG